MRLPGSATSRSPASRCTITSIRVMVGSCQFFALDVGTDPAIPVTRSMVDGLEVYGRAADHLSSGFGCGRASWGRATPTSMACRSGTPARIAANAMNPKTSTPNVLQPKPVPYGGWNIAGTMRIGIQQTFESLYNGKRIDIDSMSADLPRAHFQRPLLDLPPPGARSWPEGPSRRQVGGRL